MTLDRGGLSPVSRQDVVFERPVDAKEKVPVPDGLWDARQPAGSAARSCNPHALGETPPDGWDLVNSPITRTNMQSPLTFSGVCQMVKQESDPKLINAVDSIMSVLLILGPTVAGMPPKR